MKLWGAVVGGLLGFAGSGEFGLVSGALLGLLAGVWAESAVRRLARDTYRDVLDAELDEIVARRVAAELGARGAAPPPPEPAREAPAASVPRVRAAARAVAPPPTISQPLPEPASPPETIELPARSYAETLDAIKANKTASGLASASCSSGSAFSPAMPPMPGCSRSSCGWPRSARLAQHCWGLASTAEPSGPNSAWRCKVPGWAYST